MGVFIKALLVVFATSLHCGYVTEGAKHKGASHGAKHQGGSSGKSHSKVIGTGSKYKELDFSDRDIPPGYKSGKNWQEKPDGSWVYFDPPTEVRIPNKLPYNPIFTPKGKPGSPGYNIILSIGEANDRSHFKITPTSKNPNDYDITAVESPNNPVPIKSGPTTPKIITSGQGKRGTPTFSPVLALRGPEGKKKYYKIKRDPKETNGFKITPQMVKGRDSKPTGPRAKRKPETTVPPKYPGWENPNEGYQDIDAEPRIKKVGKPNDPNYYELIGVGKDKHRRYFKKIPNNENPKQYVVKPILSPDKPDSKPDPDDPEPPKVYPFGKKGTPDYQQILGIGPKGKKTFISIIEDKNNPGNYNYFPVEINEPPDTPEIPDGWENPNEGYKPIPDQPLVKKIGKDTDPNFYQIYAIGPPDKRRYFKLVPKEKNPYDYSLDPIASPDNPDLKPDESDPEYPIVIPYGHRGSDDYSPIMVIGPNEKQKFFRLTPNPNTPGNYNVGEVQMDQRPRPPAGWENPNDGYVDFPEKPMIKKVGKPGDPKFYEIIALGLPKQRRYFKKTPSKTNNPYDYSLKPILSPDKPDSKPDPNDPEPPKVYIFGKKGTPTYSPVMGVGPTGHKKFYQETPDKNNPDRNIISPVTMEEPPDQPEIPEGWENPNEGYKDIPELPLVKKIGKETDPKYYQIYSIGPPDKKHYFKMVPKQGSPYDYSLDPITSPDNPDQAPDDSDPEYPVVIPFGHRGSPNYTPVMVIGPNGKQKFFQLSPNPTAPGKYNVGEVQMDQRPRPPAGWENPNEGYEDFPEKPMIKKVGKPEDPNFYEIISLGLPNHRRYFKKTPGKKDNPNDYTLKPILSPEKPDQKPDPADSEPPKVYPYGEKGKPTYTPIMGVGPKGQKKFYRELPDKNNPGRMIIAPVGMAEPPDQPEIPEGWENPNEGFQDLPDFPLVKNVGNPSDPKHYKIIAIGPENKKHYFKMTPGDPKNPKDYSLKPIGEPDEPDSTPNPDDIECSDILVIGEQGSPHFNPLMKIGTKDTPKYFNLVPNEKKPGEYHIFPVSIEVPPESKITTTEIPTEEPDDDEFDDLPENPEFRKFGKPGTKTYYEVISVGPKNHRQHFKKIPGNLNKPYDYEISPIADPKNPKSTPDPNDSYAPHVYPNGKGKRYSPVIAVGPKKDRKYFRLKPSIKHPGTLRFIPVKPKTLKPGSKEQHFTDIPRKKKQKKFTTEELETTTTEEPESPDFEPDFEALPENPKIQKFGSSCIFRRIIA